MVRFLVVLLSSCVSVFAELPPAPASGVRDEARFFTADGLARLKAETDALFAATGIRTFVDANTYLEGGQRGSERARDLVEAWGKDVSCVVICLDRSAPRPGSVDVSSDLWQRYTEPELMRLLARAVAAISQERAGESLVIDAMQILREGLIERHAESIARSQLLSPGDLPLLTTFALVVGVGALLSVWLVRRNRVREAEEDVRHYFPEAEVAPRLGAPNGGGVMAAVQYRRG